MSQEFRWDAETMRSLLSKTRSSKQALSESLVGMHRLMSELESSPWRADHQVVFMAWMTLLKQYHEKLANCEVAGSAGDAISKFLVAWAGFETTSPGMQTLGLIS